MNEIADVNISTLNIWHSILKPLICVSIQKIYQTLETVFQINHISKPLEFRQKYSATRRIFNSLLGVWKSDETLSLAFDININFGISLSILAAKRSLLVVKTFFKLPGPCMKLDSSLKSKRGCFVVRYLPS